MQTIWEKYEGRLMQVRCEAENPDDSRILELWVTFLDLLASHRNDYPNQPYGLHVTVEPLPEMNRPNANQT